MPSFKSFKTGLLSRTKSSQSETMATVADDSPESNAQRGVRLFCESGSPLNQGEEVLHLPVIVESAESSPSAATACAYQIRKFLSKENYDKPHVQYNAIMLLRILSENPGPTFTRNIDKKFVETTATLLRTGKDPSVQQILRETLDAFEAERYNDEGLKKLLEMWRSNKGYRAAIMPHTGGWGGAGFVPAAGGGNSGGGSRQQLPSPVELAGRVEESRNTAKILMQLVQSTPTEEVLGNDLLKEFAERCQSAQRSMQAYINCDSPPPDDDTLQTLIEVTEQLSLSLSKHQRSVLMARRAAGLTTSAAASPDPETQAGQNVYANPIAGHDGRVDEAPQSPNAQALQAARERAAERERVEARERMEALEAEQERQNQQQRQQTYSPPAGPPPGRTTEQDPFGDNAERSNYGHSQTRPTYEYRTDEGPRPETTPQQQPVTYRY
ncbi:Dihydrolipoyllysine-residue succinyltransferase component of 2-oxoglutarate dehydrogenase complex, mitochondrial [Sphaceloma murrayae]|uniref:Dihydrolipoyllysine-residue succinyltransferase component of 2-oxoglutarate dehydrogenase complex, mitochondrial n=1 Tax=Sphaceloma murrayae TaxID=2082308 RepID=A0A2K1QJ83_9PEZI|nr:Dihydrolipoyllysine-residue succinyltransferase component of 2-oxoglutarate dehydrogenase complex, mitochondrial [Sphaceloma murrayae]